MWVCTSYELNLKITPKYDGSTIIFCPFFVWLKQPITWRTPRVWKYKWKYEDVNKSFFSFLDQCLSHHIKKKHTTALILMWVWLPGFHQEVQVQKTKNTLWFIFMLFIDNEIRKQHFCLFVVCFDFVSYCFKNLIIRNKYFPFEWAK